MTIEERITALGLVLPAPIQPPPGLAFPFAPVCIAGTRAIVSGHSATDAQGNICGPFGKVGGEVTIEQAHEAARQTALSMLASLKLALGSLDRVGRWLRVFGMVNSAPGFNRQVAVINGFSHLILDVFGAEGGRSARSAVGMAELPFGIPVEVEAEVELVD